IADTSRIELVARTVVNLRLRPCHASLIGGDRRSALAAWRSSAPSAAPRSASTGLVAKRCDAQHVRNRGISGSARLALETTLMTLSGSGIGTRRWATSPSELTSELPSEFIDERS